MSNKDIEQRIKKTSEYQLAPDGKGNNTTPQLPVEVVEQINTFVNEKTNAEREYWNKAVADPERFKTYMSGYESGVYVGATAYATKLQEVQQDNDRLKIALGNVYRIHGHQWSEYDRAKAAETRPRR